MIPIDSIYAAFYDLDGEPLENGYVYIGEVNQNPETAPVSVYWDYAGTQPAAQPLRTLNGFLHRTGTPANVFVSGDYSITVRGKSRELIFTAPSAAGAGDSAALFTGANGSSLIGFLQAGTGAVEISLQQKGRQYINVDEFIHDDDPDDTLGMQRAIDSVAPTTQSNANATIHWSPHRNYSVSAPVIPRGAGLILDGHGAKITATASAMEAIFDCGNVFISGNNQSCQINNFRLDCASLAYHGIRIQQATDCSYRNVRVDNWVRSAFYLRGIEIKQLKNILFDSCFGAGADNTTGYGWEIEESGAVAVNNFTLIILLNCEVGGGDTAVRITTTHYPARLKILLGAYQNNASYDLRAIGAGTVDNAPHVSIDTIHTETGGGLKAVKLEGGAHLYTENCDGLLPGTVEMDADSRWFDASSVSRDVDGNLMMNGVEIVGSSPPSLQVCVNDGRFGELLVGQSATTGQAAVLCMARVASFGDAMWSQNLFGVAAADTYQTIATGPYAGIVSFLEDTNKRGLRFITSAAAQTGGTQFTPTYAGGVGSTGAHFTAAPTGGSGLWKFGIANAVAPTAPNRTITLEVDGTTYYLAAKTTND